MLALDLKELQDQLKEYEEAIEKAKAQLYRLDGAAQALRALIKSVESPS